MVFPTSRKSMRLWTGTRVPRKQGTPLIRSRSVQTASVNAIFCSAVTPSLFRCHSFKVSDGGRRRKDATGSANEEGSGGRPLFHASQDYLVAGGYRPVSS